MRARTGSMGDEDDRVLVAAVRRGSRDAVAELFGTHWRGLWRSAFVILGDRGAAEDVAQDAFLAALAALDRFDDRRPFGPWARRIAVNRALDELRARRRRGEQVHGDDVPWVDELDDDLAELVGALGRIGVERRVPIVLHHLLGYRVDEIAEIAGVPAGTVASRMSRGLSQLRSTLEVHRAD
jgi:RNA polymerase sigma-70 factor (ECF subfamily)